MYKRQGVQHVYEDYARFLMDEADIKKLEKDIIEGNNLKNADFAYEKDGYDTDLVAVTLGKVADTCLLYTSQLEVLS